MCKHVALWIGHKEARVLHLHSRKTHEIVLMAPHHIHHHQQGAQLKREQSHDTKRFFHEVVRSLDGARELLVVGPAGPKQHFLRYMHKHERAQNTKVLDPETGDPLGDQQFVSYARSYFKRDEPHEPIA